MHPKLWQQQRLSLQDWVDLLRGLIQLLPVGRWSEGLRQTPGATALPRFCAAFEMTANLASSGKKPPNTRIGDSPLKKPSHD